MAEKPEDLQCDEGSQPEISGESDSGKVPQVEVDVGSSEMDTNKSASQGASEEKGDASASSTDKPEPVAESGPDPELKPEAELEPEPEATTSSELVDKGWNSETSANRSFSGSNSFTGNIRNSSDFFPAVNELNDVPDLSLNVSLPVNKRTSNQLTQLERVEKRENIRLLEQIPLLKNLHKWEKSKIAEHLQFRNYEENEVIVLEGDEADEFYIVKDGVVDISVDAGEGKTKTLSTITRRGWFGELALLKDQPRNATAKARTKVECLVLVKEDFIRLIGTLEEVLNRGNVVARHKKATERWHRAYNIVSKTLLLLRRIRKEQERKLDWKTLRFGGPLLEKAYRIFLRKETVAFGSAAAAFSFMIILAFFIHDILSPTCHWSGDMYWMSINVISMPLVLVLGLIPNLDTTMLKRYHMFLSTLASAFLWVTLMCPWLFPDDKSALERGSLFFLARLTICISFVFHFAPLGIVRTSFIVAAMVAVSEVLLLQPRMRDHEYDFGDVHHKGDSTMSILNMQAVVLLSLISNYTDHRRKEKDHRKAFILAYDIHEEWKSSEAFLHSMLPNKAISALKRGQKLFAEWIENGTVVFIQICDFNRFVENMPPRKLINLLNDIFSSFDSLVDSHRVYKIETVNEYYMAGSGILKNDKYHAVNSAACAVAMLKVCEEISEKIEGESFAIKIGLNSGSLIAGVIGLKQINYRVFGDTVNIASRMCSHSKPGKIMCTKRTAGYLKKSRNYKFELEDLGEIPIKGKGEMHTYYLQGAQLVTPTSPALSARSDNLFGVNERSSFNERCSFNERDSFNERSSFNETSSFNEGDRSSNERDSTERNNASGQIVDLSEEGNSFKSFSRRILHRVSSSTRRLSRLSFSENKFGAAAGRKKSLIKAQIDVSVLSHQGYKPEPSEPVTPNSVPASPLSIASSTAFSPAAPPFPPPVGNAEGKNVEQNQPESFAETLHRRRNSVDSVVSMESADVGGGDDEEGRITLDADNLGNHLTKVVSTKKKRRSVIESMSPVPSGKRTLDKKRKSEARRKSFIEKLYPEMDLSLEAINAYEPKQKVALKALRSQESGKLVQAGKAATKRQRKGSIVHDMWKKNANKNTTQTLEKVQINKVTLQFVGKDAADIEELYQHRKLYELKQHQSAAIAGLGAVLILKLMFELEFKNLNESKNREYLLGSLLSKSLYVYFVSMIFKHNELKIFREIRMTKNEILVLLLVILAAVLLFVSSFVEASATVLIDAIVCIFLIHYSFHACIFKLKALVGIIVILVLPCVILILANAGESIRFKQVDCSTSAILIFSHTIMILYSIHNEEFLRRKQYLMRRDLLAQNKVFELLIYNLVPPQIVYKLRRGQTYLVTQHPDASVLFADIKGFTPLTASVPAIVLVGFLNTLFSALDDLCIKEKVYKVNTIGDCYVVAAGVPTRIPYHAEATMEFARKMLCTIVVVRDDVSQFRKEFKDISMRIGIHSGPVTSGVVGKKSIRYEIWGKTVEFANKMESSGVPMRIHCSQDTQTFLRYSYNFEYRAKLGTYLLIDSEEAQREGIEKSRRTLELLLT